MGLSGEFASIVWPVILAPGKSLERARRGEGWSVRLWPVHLDPALAYPPSRSSTQRSSSY
jgi:hypothetical protein